MMRRTGQRGQTLVEIVLAVGIVALVMTAVVSVIAVSVQNSAQAKARVLATKYNQEVIEMFRRERARSGWDAFDATLRVDGTSITYCLATIPTSAQGFSGLQSGACGANQYVDARQIFQRQAQVNIVNTGGSDVITVTSTVTWTENGRTKTSQMIQVFRQALSQ